jgi:hypothetical protein
VTLEEVPDPGRVWAALSAARQETGLVPILLGGLAMDYAQLWEDEELGPIDVTQLDHMDAATLGLLGQAARPWDEEEFDYPADVTQLDHMDAASLLKSLWDGRVHEENEEGEDEETVEFIEAAIAPFSRQFPGLAPLRTISSVQSNVREYSAPCQRRVSG